MQEPLDNLSDNARKVHEQLEDVGQDFDVIAARAGLSAGDTANALRELKAARHAAETMGGWSIIR